LYHSGNKRSVSNVSESINRAGKGEKVKYLKLVAAVGLMAAFLTAGAAFAQWQGGQGSHRMSCQDRFDAMDTNHDGKLTMEEFMAAPHRRGNPEERFKAMDVNGRGYITKEEFCSGRGDGARGR
jgi:Ca2+-binding EF-hand superfamily protein